MKKNLKIEIMSMDSEFIVLKAMTTPHQRLQEQQ